MDHLKKESLIILNKVAEAITTAGDAQSLADALFKVVDDFIDVPYSSIFLWDFKQEKLRLYANKGFTEEDKKYSEDTAMERHPGWVFKNRQPLSVQDMSAGNIPSYVKSGKRNFEVKSRLWFPITTIDRSLGAFGFSSAEVNYFTEEHQRILELVCRLAGNMYANIVFSESEKQYVESLKLSMRKIQDANNAQQNFISKMSHEMRTPLNGILGMSRLLENTGVQTAQQKYIDIIKSQSAELLNVVNDLLDLSKVDSENFQPIRFPFDICEAFDNGTHPYERYAQQKSIALICKKDCGNNFKLQGDALRFTQVVSNLVSNAVKFTSKGKVEVTLFVIEDDGNMVKFGLEVADTGTGIAPADREKIFGRFIQGDDSISRHYGGTGLGLYITREIILRMGGSISVSGEVGQGSCFRVEVPFEKYISEHAPGSRVSRQNFSGFNALVVEDNSVNSLYLTSILKQKGFEVEEASDGQKAVDLCKVKKFDVVLMDLQMPEMDGISATRIIRNQLKCTMPIIAQSANTVQKDIDACYEAGMNDYLSKPFSSEKLFAKLALALGVSESESRDAVTDKKSRAAIIFENALKISENNSDLAKRLLQIFIQETPKGVENLKKAIDDKNLPTVKKLGHKYKSSFRLMGVSDAADDCFKLEKTPETETVDWQLITDTFERIDLRTREIVDEIKSIL